MMRGFRLTLLSSIAIYALYFAWSGGLRIYAVMTHPLGWWPVTITSLIYFVGGIALAASMVVSWWRPIPWAYFGMIILLVFAASLVQQTLVHPEPMAVLPARTPFFIADLFLAGLIYIVVLTPSSVPA
jgi:hypothetical protein